MFPLGNAARATRWVSLGIGAISCGWSDIAILLGSKDGDQTPSLQTLLASGLCEITLRCLMMPHEIGIGPRLMSCKSEFASSINKREVQQCPHPSLDTPVSLTPSMAVISAGLDCQHSRHHDRVVRLSSLRDS